MLFPDTDPFCLLHCLSHRPVLLARPPTGYVSRPSTIRLPHPSNLRTHPLRSQRRGPPTHSPRQPLLFFSTYSIPSTRHSFPLTASPPTASALAQNPTCATVLPTTATWLLPNPPTNTSHRRPSTTLPLRLYRTPARTGSPAARISLGIRPRRTAEKSSSTSWDRGSGQLLPCGGTLGLGTRVDSLRRWMEGLVGRGRRATGILGTVGRRTYRTAPSTESSLRKTGTSLSLAPDLLSSNLPRNLFLPTASHRPLLPPPSLLPTSSPATPTTTRKACRRWHLLARRTSTTRRSLLPLRRRVTGARRRVGVRMGGRSRSCTSPGLPRRLFRLRRGGGHLGLRPSSSGQPNFAPRGGMSS